MTRTNISFKDSSISWIGHIPNDWVVKKLKFEFRYITGATPDSGKIGYYGGNNNWITISDLDGKYTGESKNKITELAVKEKNMKIVPKGSLLYSFKLSVGQLAFVSEDTYTNEAIFAILEKEGLNLDFWYYALGSYFINNANENIYGAKIFNQFYIDNGLVIVPNMDSQTTIANYLNTKTTQISEFIIKKKQLISLLQEQKQAIIHQAVTKGIHSSTRMKDSGIAWIGEIPEGWEVKKLKHILDDIQIGPFGSMIKSDILVEEGIKIYGQENIINSDFTLGYRCIDQQKFQELQKYQIHPGEILVSMMGTIGKCEIVPENIETGIIDSHLMKFTLNKDFIENVFFQIVYSGGKYIWHQLVLENKGSVMMGLNSSIIKNLYLVVPCIAEQQKIVSYIESRTSKIEQAITKIEQEIELIQEYRTSLIYHAVTGKINIK